MFWALLPLSTSAFFTVQQWFLPHLKRSENLCWLPATPEASDAFDVIQRRPSQALLIQCLVIAGHTKTPLMHSTSFCPWGFLGFLCLRQVPLLRMQGTSYYALVQPNPFKRHLRRTSLPACLMLKRSPGSKIYGAPGSTIELLKGFLAIAMRVVGRGYLTTPLLIQNAPSWRPPTRTGLTQHMRHSEICLKACMRLTPGSVQGVSLATMRLESSWLMDRRSYTNWYTCLAIGHWLGWRSHLEGLASKLIGSLRDSAFRSWLPTATRMHTKER